MTLTPEQFNQLATKDNLKDLEVKLTEQLASKNDLKKVDDKVNRVYAELLNTKTEVKEIKDNMATKEDINKVLNAVDSVMSGYKEVKVEQVANQGAHDRMQGDIDLFKKQAGMPV